MEEIEAAAASTASWFESLFETEKRVRQRLDQQDVHAPQSALLQPAHDVGRDSDPAHLELCERTALLAQHPELVALIDGPLGRVWERIDGQWTKISDQGEIT